MKSVVKYFFSGVFLEIQNVSCRFYHQEITTRRLWNGIKLRQKRYEFNLDLDFVETHLSSSS